jgi:hypothetical protein
LAVVERVDECRVVDEVDPLWELVPDARALEEWWVPVPVAYAELHPVSVSATTAASTEDPIAIALLDELTSIWKS